MKTCINYKAVFFIDRFVLVETTKEEKELISRSIERERKKRLEMQRKNVYIKGEVLK
jgi:hypothetical protein